MKGAKLFIIFAYIQFSLYLILIVSLFYFLEPSLFFETISSERIKYSIKLSILCATIATFLSIIVAIPTAYALSRFEFFGKKFIDILLELPLIVSPAALGAMILIFFNNPIGNWLKENSFDAIFTVKGIVLAQFIATAGSATRLIKAVIDEIPKRYEDVARTLGATPIKAFYTITLPLSKKGIYASSILTWAKALGEFGATITVAGTMALKTETLPIAIFMSLTGANIREAVVLIFLILSIGFGLIFVVKNIISIKKKYADY